MKLDYKRTLKVGIAFLGIMLFWEVYDFAVPILLSRTFGLTEWQYGLVMGLDNLLALFLLPLFGAISDKRNSKHGRRTPFIFYGTIAAVLLLIVMSIVENMQFQNVFDLGIGNPGMLFEGGYLLSDPAVATTSEIAEASRLMASEYTAANPGYLIAFIGVLLLLLVAMSSYRSPAVALMPDVTVKPLRSQANAMINLMGGAGGFLSIILYTFLSEQYESFLPLFFMLAIFMLIALAVYLFAVKEPEYVRMRMDEEVKWNVVDEEEVSVETKLPRGKKISLIFILLTIFFWFMGFNAVKSHLSVYGLNQLGFTTSQVGLINIVNGVGGAIGLIPVALLANKIGRKKSVIIGLIIAFVAFIPAFFITPETKWALLACFVIAGVGLIIINVNTLPMVVELSKGSNVGKFTGYYYAFSMSAQAITPYLAGLVMGQKQEGLFLYGAGMIAISMIMMLFVRHGDNRPDKKLNKLEYFDAD